MPCEPLSSSCPLGRTPTWSTCHDDPRPAWKAFFFGALDSGSFITVDKPPFALWVMGLSARVFGYGSGQLTLPMVAVGTGSVALL